MIDTAMFRVMSGSSCPVPDDDPESMTDHVQKDATPHIKPYDKVLQSCLDYDRDPGIIAFVSYDTCGPESPVRNCTPGEALFMGVISMFLDIPINTQSSKILRDSLRKDLMHDPTNHPPPSLVVDGDVSAAGPHLMQRSMKQIIKVFFSRLGEPDASREDKLMVMRRSKWFLTDIMQNKVGTDVFRDPALDLLRRMWSSGTSLTDTGGWDNVRFPIVFHLQWDAELTKSGKPRMLFHTTFDPWRTAAGLAMALCSPMPPIQVRETPYKDTSTLRQYQPPRKYVIDWDLFVNENLGKAGPIDMFTEVHNNPCFMYVFCHCCIHHCRSYCACSVQFLYP